MDNKVFCDQLSYHYSDGKLSLWVDREQKNFKRCKSPVTRLSSQGYSCSGLKTQLSEFIFHHRFILFSLRPGIYCYCYLT